jgi:hypothetical protein
VASTRPARFGPPERIPVILCIDIEPDDRITDRNDRRPWKGFEASFQFFSTLRERLAEATGKPAHYSWFVRLDPQVALTYGSPSWPVDEYSNAIGDLARQGDEIGLHAHAYRWDDLESGWLADYRDQAWVDHCVRSSFETYARAFGRSCESFRFGDRWMSTATMKTVEDLGARFDLTLEPGHPAVDTFIRHEKATGGIPDYRHVPRHPYQPSHEDFRSQDRTAARTIWEIPLSSGYVADWAPAVIDLYRRIPGAGRYPLHLTLGLWQRPALFERVMNRLLRAPHVPHLAFAVRSDLPLRPEMTRMCQIFERLLAHPWIDRLTFSTPAEMMAGLLLENPKITPVR